MAQESTWESGLISRLGARTSKLACLVAAVAAVACSGVDSSSETVGQLQSEVVTPNWFPIGPAPGPDGVNGRVTAIAVNPANTNQVWLGTPNGGVWRTTGARDIEVVWTPMSDFADSLAVGDIALADCTASACNTVYVGTGENSLRRQTYSGTGILVLTPRRAPGKTLPTGTGADYVVSKFVDSERAFSGGTIQRLLVVNPGATGPRDFFAAVSAGNTSGSHPATVTHPPPANGYGIHHFDAPTQKWQRLSVPPGAPINQFLPTDFRRIGLHPLGNPNGAEPVLFAGFAELGIYSSRDNGATWCPLNPVPGAFIPAGCPVPVATCPATPTAPCGLPSATRACPAAGCLPPPLDGVNATEPRFDAVRVAGSDAIAGGRDAVLYLSLAGDLTGERCPHSYTALIEGPFDCPATLFVSLDGGVRWDPVNDVESATGGFGVYDFYAHVLEAHPDPSRANTLAYGGLVTAVSNDGGTSFANQSNGHTDQHSFSFAADDLWLSGNDGGVWRSRDQGASWESLNKNLQIMQFYGGDVDNGTECSNVVGDPANCDAFVLAGAQDNSCMLFKGLLAWQEAPCGGDGGDAVIIDKDTAFTSRYEETPLNAKTGALFEGGQLRQFGKRTFANPRGDAFVLQPPFAYQREANLLWMAGDLLYSTSPAAPNWTVQSSGPQVDSPRFGALSQTCTLATPPESNPQADCPNGQICRPGYLDPTVAHCYPFYGDIEGTNAITSIAFSPLTQSTYIGLYDGEVWKKSGTTLSQIRAGESCVHAPPSRPGGAPPEVAGGVGTRCHPVTALGVDPTVTDHDRVFAGISGFQIAGSHLQVFDGASFVPVVGGALSAAGQLDVPVQAIGFGPETPPIMYVGTDRGVIHRDALGTFVKDSVFGSGIPAVPVYGFATDRTRGRLYAVTHGRGMFVKTDNGDPIAHLKEGWLPRELCGSGATGPCLSDLQLSAEGLSTPGASCSVQVLTSQGTACASGSFAPSSLVAASASGVAIKVTDETNLTSPNYGKLTTRANRIWNDRQLVPVCFDGMCVGPAPDQLTPIQNCNGDIARVRLQCGTRVSVIDVGASRPQSADPPTSVFRLDAIGPNAGPPTRGDEGGGEPLGVDGSLVLTASLVKNAVSPPLCAVRVAYTAADASVDVAARAADAFNSDPVCRSRGVSASIPATPRLEGEDDEPFQPVLRLRAQSQTGVALQLGVQADPGNAGVCFNFGQLPGYARSQLDSTQITFATPTRGALGGKLTWVQSSPLGACRITIATRTGQGAAEIAGALRDASLAAATDPGVPGCPASANPGLLRVDGERLSSRSLQALTICTTDPGVGVSVQPVEVTEMPFTVP